MKIAIISDIHSNIEALKVVFSYLEKEGIDKMISLGDVIGLGPYPKECVDLLMANKDKFISFIKGNHEGYIIDGLPLYNHNDPNGRKLDPDDIAMHHWNHSFINKEELDFLKTFKVKDRLNIEGHSILLEHYPMDNNNSFNQFYKFPTLEEIKGIYENDIDDIYLFGHTHVLRYYEDNNKYYINPGSLGCPVLTHGAPVGILDISKDKVCYNQVILDYDIEKVRNDMRKFDFPQAEWMIELFYGYDK